MFAMHQTTRRRLCRVVFLMACLVPTLAVAAWAAWVNTSQYAIAQQSVWESRLSSRLGARVKIARVSNPSATVTLLEDVQLFTPETERQLAAIRVIEIFPHRDGWIAAASQPTVEADRLPELWTLLHGRLIARRFSGAPTVWLQCAELTLTGANDEQTITQVSCRWSDLEGGPELLTEFSLAGYDPDRRCRLAVRRRRAGEEATTSLELQADAPLPCAVVGQPLPLLAAMGADCRFVGKATIKFDSSGWSGSLEDCTFRNVDLRRLIMSCSLQSLRGVGEVGVDSARFAQGRLLEAEGHLQVENGVIGLSFLRAIHKQMQVAVPDRVLQDGGRKLWNYTKLACDFKLDSDGLSLDGQCGGAFQGAIMADVDGPLMLQTQRPQITAVSFVRALAPASDIQVPATVQTERLISALPIPDIRRATPTEPIAPLRLQGSN